MALSVFRSKEDVAALVEKMLLSYKPQIWEESRLLDLTLQQLRALALLYSTGPMRMGTISSRLRIGMPAATSLISKLEEKGLVTREHNTEDRRVVLCFATNQGAAELERFWRIKREQINYVIGLLNEEERELVGKAADVVLRATENTRRAGSDDVVHTNSTKTRPGAVLKSVYIR